MGMTGGWTLPMRNVVSHRGSVTEEGSGLKAGLGVQGSGYQALGRRLETQDS